MINKVILVGRLGKDPETRYMPNGKAVTSFSLATSTKSKDKEYTEWHNVETFDRLAEICAEYLQKGKQVYIEGRLQTDKWEKDGVTHYRTKIVAQQMQMLGGKDGN